MENGDELYDVLLSYHSRDGQTVGRVARALLDHGARVFCDRWYLIPGLPWPQALDRILDRGRALAIFVGANGLGRWQRPETDLAFDRQKREEIRGVTFPVIPVILL